MILAHNTSLVLIMSRDFNNFSPFFICQNKHYAEALRELESGRRESTAWTAFVFPRLISPHLRRKKSSYFELKSVAEARNYLDNPVLAARLIEASNVALAWLRSDKISVVELMGCEVEALRLLSCATLFEHASIGRVCHSLFAQLRFQCQEQLGVVDKYTQQICTLEAPVIQT